MEAWMQNAIVGGCIVIALIFILRKIFKKSATEGGSCGSCSGCGSNSNKRCG